LYDSLYIFHNETGGNSATIKAMIKGEHRDLMILALKAESRAIKERDC